MYRPRIYVQSEGTNVILPHHLLYPINLYVFSFAVDASAANANLTPPLRFGFFEQFELSDLLGKPLVDGPNPFFSVLLGSCAAEKVVPRAGKP